MLDIANSPYVKPTYTSNPGVGEYLRSRGNGSSKYPPFAVEAELVKRFGTEERFKSESIAGKNPGPGTYEHDFQ